MEKLQWFAAFYGYLYPPKLSHNETGNGLTIISWREKIAKGFATEHHVMMTSETL